MMSNELTKEKETVISFKNVTKEYKLYKNEKARFRGMFNKKVPFKLKRAVDNLSFEVKKGDGLALIGRNGAGKPRRRKWCTRDCKKEPYKDNRMKLSFINQSAILYI